MSKNNNENGWWCHSCGKSYGTFDTPGWSSMRGPLCCCTDQTPDKRDIDRWTVCIPIATLCNPPEPTVIEASDLAPGMVVVTVDDGFTLGETTWIQRWDVKLSDRGVAISSCGFQLPTATPSKIRRIAGKVTP